MRQLKMEEKKQFLSLIKYLCKDKLSLHLNKCLSENFVYVSESMTKPAIL